MLLLASNSPRRKQLLALTGWPFELATVDIDERCLPGEPPLAYVLRLARSKAQAAASQAPPEAIILAADTTVVATGVATGVAAGVEGDEILGKPADHTEAAHMLQRLRGRTHQVYTGLAVLRVSDGTLRTDWCVTAVPMRQYSDAEMQAYIASGDPLDKAGAYAIQHAGFHPVENLSGCYANVVGLPLCHLARTLRAWGCLPPQDVPAACQAALTYRCPVYRQVLQGDH